MSNEEKEKAEEIKELSNDDLIDLVGNDICSHIQPVLYMKKAIPDNSILKKDNAPEMLHVSPIKSSALLTMENVTRRLFCNEYTESFGTAAYALGNNQLNITVEEFTNYIVQNTLISFCAMIDNTGELFRAMVLNTRIKGIVQEELLDEENYVSSIKGFISRFLTRQGDCSFISTFDTTKDGFKPEDIDKDFNGLQNFNDNIVSQLDQLIYFKLCRACDRAISEILLGTRISPNQKYIVDAGIKYFGLKMDTSIDYRYEVYYRLNLELVNMLNKFMSAVIVPMSDLVVNRMAYLTYYYIYNTIARMNTSKKHNNSNVIDVDQFDPNAMPF